MPRPSKRKKLDSIDRENIQATTESHGWQLISERIHRTLGAKLEELVQPSDAIQTAEIRGYIAGLRLALAIPGILTKEAKEAGNAGIE